MIINTEYYKDKDDSDYNPDILKLSWSCIELVWTL